MNAVFYCSISLSDMTPNFSDLTF